MQHDVETQTFEVAFNNTCIANCGDVNERRLGPSFLDRLRIGVEVVVKYSDANR